MLSIIIEAPAEGFGSWRLVRLSIVSSGLNPSIND